jgi:metallo-beta-lactamase family protein
VQLEFYGAAGEVTGSCHVLRAAGRQILLDCGMIQGGRRDEARNHDPFPFRVSDIDAVVLSHSHIDHSGRLPLLVRHGYQGPIYTHYASRDLCEILLQDSAQLSERDARTENRRRERKGLPAIAPLYRRQHARAVIRLAKGLHFRSATEILPGITLTLHDAGHIMGSAIVELSLIEDGERHTLVFSGDLGPRGAPILHDPAVPEHADTVIMESTYGDRAHRSRDATVQELGEIIRSAERDRGNILIPAFAIGRSQEVLYMLGKHYDEWDLDRWHIFLDSPMAIDASEVYWNYPHLYDDEATMLRHRINEMPRLRNLHLTETVEESRVINRVRNGAIVIAGSGMCNGGRIVHHLKHNLWRRECHVVIVGYQAAGSLGRQLVDGRQFVRIQGEAIKVNAQIHTIGGLSAHGDQNDLLHWYGAFANRPRVFLVHGESETSDTLRELIGRRFGAVATVAQTGQVIDLLASSRRGRERRRPVPRPAKN